MRLAFLLFMWMPFFSTFAQSNNTNCEDVTTGEFYVINGKDTCFIKRTSNRQKEQCQGSDVVYELIVIWLKDDKYILRDINYNPTTAPRVMRKDRVMSIIEIGPDYHVVRMKSKEMTTREFTVYCNKN
ncbi:hypothetical protein N8987_01570 [Crocinitomix sp.]|nr:hypothetical protein [Crocinitomix sp.]